MPVFHAEHSELVQIDLKDYKMENTGVSSHEYNDIDRKNLIPLTVRSSAVP